MGIGFNPFHVDDSNNIRSSSPQKKISESENIRHALVSELGMISTMPRVLDEKSVPVASLDAVP